MRKALPVGVITLALILILVPLGYAQIDPANCVNTYMIVDGDTLSEIAKQFNVDMNELAQLNGIQNPSYIRIGDYLCLDGLVSAQPAPNQTPTVTPQPPPITPPIQPITGIGQVSVTLGGRTYATDANSYYTVQAQDNLYRIGLAFGVSRAQLAAVNGIQDQNRILAGTRLFIPMPTPSTTVPGSIPAIAIQPRLAGPGDTVTVQGYNYPPGATVNLYLEKPSLNRRSDVILSTTVLADGTFTTPVVVPATWTDGAAIDTRTVSISGRADNNIHWGMNFFINSAWTGN